MNVDSPTRLCVPSSTGSTSCAVVIASIFVLNSLLNSPFSRKPSSENLTVDGSNTNHNENRSDTDANGGPQARFANVFRVKFGHFGETSASNRSLARWILGSAHSDAGRLGETKSKRHV